ncbi:MAG: LysR substrate-binding domain-containing protein [Silanimonas sp.]
MPVKSALLIPLLAFEAAARHQNFARAGEELHLTASAISHHVRALEARLGTALFARHARGVTLTAAGMRLANASTQAFEDLAASLDGLRDDDDSRDEIHLTTLHSFATAWLIPRLPDFHAQHPGLRMKIETETALSRFDEGGPELGIRFGNGEWPELEKRFVLGDALRVVASPARVPTHATMAVGAVLDLPLIGDFSRQGWPDWCRAAGLSRDALQPRLHMRDTVEAIAAAVAGLGALLTRVSIVTPWLDSGALVTLPGPVLPSRWSYYLVKPKGRRLKPAAQAFSDWLLGQASTATAASMLAGNTAASSRSAGASRRGASSLSAAAKARPAPKR